MPTTRTPSRPGMVAVGGHTPPKDVEAAIDGYMRSESCGVSFDSAALTLGVTGESLRLQLEPGDRHVLPASRVIPLLRRGGRMTRAQRRMSPPRERRPAYVPEPEPVCACGHVGDEHGGAYGHPGHTGCTVDGCECVAFEREPTEEP